MPLGAPKFGKLGLGKRMINRWIWDHYTTWKWVKTRFTMVYPFLPSEIDGLKHCFSMFLPLFVDTQPPRARTSWQLYQLPESRGNWANPGTNHANSSATAPGSDRVLLTSIINNRSWSWSSSSSSSSSAAATAAAAAAAISFKLASK